MTRACPHGHSAGGHTSPEYTAWKHMRSRCEKRTDPHWKNYGGRGITVCERWRRSFVDFFLDVGFRPSPRHTIERIDNARGYEPGNVRWATRLEQQNNTRANHRVSFNGETLAIAQWSRRLGFRRNVLANRLRRHWPIERALTERSAADGC